MATPDPMAERIEAAIRRADPAALARTDQLARLWRDYYAARGLDLTDPIVADSALRALTMTYGLLMAAHGDGELDAAAWRVVNDVMASGTAAVTVTRSAAALPRL